MDNENEIHLDENGLPKNGKYEKVTQLNYTKEIKFYENGKLHKTDGPAYIRIHKVLGSKSYYIEGFLHREDGPAIEYDWGDNEWYQYGLLHRLDGPAVKILGQNEWWISGVQYSEEQFYSYLNNCFLHATLKLELKGNINSSKKNKI